MIKAYCEPVPYRPDAQGRKTRLSQLRQLRDAQDKLSIWIGCGLVESENYHEDGNQAVIEFVGEGRSILNLSELNFEMRKKVLMATYDTKFPVMDNPVFRISTLEIDAIVAPEEATRRIIDQCEEFSSQYAEAVQ